MYTIEKYDFLPFLFWVFYMELTVVADSVEFINAFKKIEKFLSCSYRDFDCTPYVHFCVEGDSLCILASRRVTFIYIKLKVRSLEDVKFNISVLEFRKWFKTFDKTVVGDMKISVSEDLISFTIQDTHVVFSNNKYDLWDSKRYAKCLRKGFGNEYVKQEFAYQDLALKKGQNLYLHVKDGKINRINDDTFKVGYYFYDGNVMRCMLSLLGKYNKIKMYLCSYCCMLKSENVWIVISTMKP